MNTMDYKARLFEMIISGKGLQYVMDTCAELLGNPFIFANQSLQLVAKCSFCEQYPEIFSWIENCDEEQLRIGQEASDAGYFRSIYREDAPVYGRITGIPVRWVAARVRIKSHILGNILMAECQSAFIEEYRELLPLVCQTVAFAFQQQEQQVRSNQNYVPSLVELLEGDTAHFPDEEALRTQFQLLGKPFPRNLRILVVRSTQIPATVDPYILDAQLTSQFPTSLGVSYKNDYIRILDGNISLGSVVEKVTQYIPISDICCGVSWVCTSVFQIRQAYLQASAAIRLRKNRHTARIYSFDAVVGPYLLEQATQANGLSPAAMLLSEVMLLLESKDGVQRLWDLAAYLSCGRNTTRAGELRGIHKNSMYYRLNRIMELTGLDLNEDDTCVQLTLSLTLLGILPFHNQEFIPDLCEPNKI